MSLPAWCDDALLLATSFLVVGLPFVPAWREWRRPGDATPLRIPADSGAPADRPAGAPALQVDADFRITAGARVRTIVAAGRLELGPGCEVLEQAHAQGPLRLEEGCTALGRLSSAACIELARGCCFERLEAPLVRFGPPVAPWAGDGAAPRPADSAALPGARRHGPALVRVEGDCVLAAGRRYEGALVVHGDLHVESGAVLHGNVKSTGCVVLAPAARIEGALIAEGPVRLHHGAGADGPVVSIGEVVLGPGACVGGHGAPTSLTAARVLAQCGARAHGLVWAQRLGLVWSAA